MTPREKYERFGWVVACDCIPTHTAAVRAIVTLTVATCLLSLSQREREAAIFYTARFYFILGGGVRSRLPMSLSRSPQCSSKASTSNILTPRRSLSVFPFAFLRNRMPELNEINVDAYHHNGRGSVCLWRRWAMLCASGFADYVMCAENYHKWYKQFFS